MYLQMLKYGKEQALAFEPAQYHKLEEGKPERQFDGFIPNPFVVIVLVSNIIHLK